MSSGVASSGGRAQRVALIGFGEAGSILGADLVVAGCDVCTYDILLDGPQSRPAVLARAELAHVRTADSFAAAAAGADWIISAVTVSSSGDVAALGGRHLRAGQIFLDINSCSPAKKQSSCRELEASGADYVEAAVMAPVPPYRLKVPMLLGGKRAQYAAEQLTGLGMNAKAISNEIGVASAVKMCRSVVIKGIESLAVESMRAARHFGAEDQVLASLDQTFPGMGWSRELPDYLISRVAEHGRRRAAEMREVASTLSDAGFEPTMASAIAASQDALVDAMSANGIVYDKDARFSWRQLADTLKPAETFKPSDILKK
jgi:3-hydroxyisobutyrate dehydrogenase-like beta-hydroxyacid dehydrogenase